MYVCVYLRKYPKCCIINPTKSKLGIIIKKMIESLNSELRKKEYINVKTQKHLQTGSST